MRLLLVTACLFATALAFGKEEMELMMYTKMKTMESCFGEDLVKKYMIKMKKAAAKCSGQDAPELELPMFENSFALVNALTSSHGQSGGGDSFDNLMEKYLKMQMIRSFSGSPRSLSPRFAKREAGDDFDLGERLQEKLAAKKDEMEAKIGNMTCILQECGMVNAEKKFDEAATREHVKEMEIEDPWLKERIVKGGDICIKYVQNLPEEFLEFCPYPEHIFRAKKFHKCMTMLKLKTCMQFDLKKKLESSFGPIDELVKTTGLEEKYLFGVIKEMLQGPQMM
jgi:hypothetical protein